MPTRLPFSGRTLRGAAVLAAGAIALVGCGGGYGNGGHASAAAPQPAASGRPGTPAPAPAAATVKVSSSGIGQVLVAADAMTLYRFDKDSGSTSNCTGACAANWPALTVSGQPVGPAGLGGSLGVAIRADGTTQVTYQGHPLYRFSGDRRPGDTNGDGIGGIWHAVRPGISTAVTTATTAGSSYSY